MERGDGGGEKSRRSPRSRAICSGNPLISEDNVGGYDSSRKAADTKERADGYEKGAAATKVHAKGAANSEVCARQDVASDDRPRQAADHQSVEAKNAGNTEDVARNDAAATDRPVQDAAGPDEPVQAKDAGDAKDDPIADAAGRKDAPAKEATNQGNG